MSSNPGSSTASFPASLGIFSLLIGLLVASIGSAVICYIRLEDQDAFPSLPNVSIAQSITICSLYLLLTLVYIYHSHTTLKMLHLKIPIVSSPFPFLGHAFVFLTRSPWDTMEKWHREFGEIYVYPLLGRTVVSLSNPKHIRIALQSKVGSVKKDIGFSYEPFLVILGSGMITSEDRHWMKQRMKMSTLLRIKVLDTIPQTTLEAVRRLMHKLDCAAVSGETVDLAESLRHLTLQVISGTFLSISAQESDSTFAQLYLPIVDECNTRVWHPYRGYCAALPGWWKHLFGVHKLNSYVSTLIQDRWNLRQSTKERHGDILDLVLDAFEKDEPGRGLTRSALRQLRDEFKTFMLAGHETSAAMMTWAFYELIVDNNLMNELREESEKVFGDAKTKDWNGPDAVIPDRDELEKLVFSLGCLKESLRKYAVVPLVNRRVVDTLDLKDYHLPRGHTLVVNIQTVHHSAEFWPEPMKFDPYRFIDKTPAPYTFLPFIEGPRNCLGQHLALLESKIVLALMAQRYTFSLEETNPVTELGGPNDPRHRYIVPVIPGKSLRVNVKRRDE